MKKPLSGIEKAKARKEPNEPESTGHAKAKKQSVNRHAQNQAHLGALCRFEVKNGVNVKENVRKLIVSGGNTLLHLERMVEKKIIKEVPACAKEVLLEVEKSQEILSKVATKNTSVVKIKKKERKLIEKREKLKGEVPKVQSQQINFEIGPEPMKDDEKAQ